MSSVEKSGNFLKGAAKVIGAGVAWGLIGDLGVVTLFHREETHRSVEVDSWLKKAILWIVRVYAPEDYVWAAVHRDHHGNSDVNRYSFWRITRAYDYLSEHPDQAPNVKVNELKYFERLDKGVKRFSLEDVLFVGHEADVEVRERMGDRYEEEIGRSEDEYKALFYPTEDQYTYSKEEHKKGEPYTMDEIAGIVLKDPHSSLLSRWKNGVLDVFLHNVNMYRKHAHFYRDEPRMRPKDLQNGTDEIVDHKKVRIRAFTETSLLLAALVHFERSGYNPKEALRMLLDPKDAATSLALGTTINTVGIGVMLFGGSFTNADGHAGEVTPEELVKANFGGEYEPKLNKGRASTNLVDAGIGGRILSAATLDEVGNQDIHHLRPDLIAYTLAVGLQSVMQAPIGKAIEFMAKSPLIPFIRVGKGFPGVAFEDRPDMQSRGGRLIEKRRDEEELAKVS